MDLTIECSEVVVSNSYGRKVELRIDDMDAETVLTDIAREVTTDEYLRVLDFSVLEEFVNENKEQQ